MRGRAWLWVLAVLVATMVLPVASSSAATTPPRPKVGSCHHYGWKVFLGFADPSSPVSCSGVYTARTFYVAPLATNEPYSKLMTDTAVLGAAAKKCTVPYIKAVGTRGLAMDFFNEAVFGPTRAQYAAGARWLRCDVVIPGNGRLLAVPHTRPAGAGATAVDEACIAKDSAGQWSETSCAAPHTFRAFGFFMVKAKTRPGVTRMHALMQQHCSKMLPQGGWFATAPTAAFWAAGQHAVTCYRKTSS